MQLRGEVANMRNAIDNFALALPLAVLLIYLVMVGLFRSLIDPVIILVAVPLGWIGTISMLHVTNTSVNVESMIGTLMMMGIVVSNSILLVDFANRMVRAGATAEKAVLEAGKRRIRPILMTALATILGIIAAGPWVRRRERDHGASGASGRWWSGREHRDDAAGGAGHAQSRPRSPTSWDSFADTRRHGGGDLMKEADRARPVRSTYRRWIPLAGGAALMIVAAMAYLYFQRAEDGISSTTPAPSSKHRCTTAPLKRTPKRSMSK